MGELVALDDKRPHLSGKALCLNCSKEWVAVAPLGTTALQCPECGLLKGVFNAVCAPEKAWQCGCGCFHFLVSPQNVICALCGAVQQFND